MSVQLISTNQRRARRLTPQQKLQILKEWEATGNGVEVTQKYHVHSQTLYRWRKARPLPYLTCRSNVNHTPYSTSFIHTFGPEQKHTLVHGPCYPLYIHIYVEIYIDTFIGGLYVINAL